MMMMMMMIKPVPNFKANMEGFFKKLFSDVHLGAVSLIHSALQRNAATLRKVLAPFFSVMGSTIVHLFLSRFFFSRSFLIFMGTGDWVLNQLRIRIPTNGSRKWNCSILPKKYYFSKLKIVQFSPTFPLATIKYKGLQMFWRENVPHSRQEV